VSEERVRRLGDKYFRRMLEQGFPEEKVRVWAENWMKAYKRMSRGYVEVRK